MFIKSGGIVEADVSSGREFTKTIIATGRHEVARMRIYEQGGHEDDPVYCRQRRGEDQDLSMGPGSEAV